LHICAKENRPEICEFLLKTLNSVAFIQKLYVNDSIEQSRTRSQHLLDLYINMPEKGLNETPLHFACKFGSLEVVRQIISFDVCSRNQLNKNQKTAQDLICTKTTNKQNFSEIKSLFEDCLYLPLYRDYESSSVIIEKPCAKLEPEIENTNTNKTNNKTPNRYLNRSQHRLAAYVGPISPTNVIKFNLLH
jgi:ankyrin repeat and LEM domain-containing protein 2